MSTEKQTSQEVFQLGEQVFDSSNERIGKVAARFARYVLVESGGFFGKAYYIPRTGLTLTNAGHVIAHYDKRELVANGFNNLPDDLYDDVPEPGVPQIFSGVPKYSKRPVSPAQTGHYNYGRRWPGINTDAAGSYHREEVLPIPQNLVQPVEETHR